MLGRNGENSAGFGSLFSGRKKVDMEPKSQYEQAKEYLRKADLHVIECVDERLSDGVENGVEIPGAVYGMVDAVKSILGLTEEQAWDYVYSHNVPIGAHIDDHHDEEGCGYAKLVQTEPGTVHAVEAVPAAERLARVNGYGGRVTTYTGSHQPTFAVINDKRGQSIDPDAAMGNGIGIFSYDRWAAHEFGKRLKMNPKQVAAHIENVYRATVARLAGINQFVVLK